MSDSESEGDDRTDDICTLCENFGPNFQVELVCDHNGCPRAYHRLCVKKKGIRGRDWSCKDLDKKCKTTSDQRWVYSFTRPIRTDKKNKGKRRKQITVRTFDKIVWNGSTLRVGDMISVNISDSHIDSSQIAQITRMEQMADAVPNIHIRWFWHAIEGKPKPGRKSKQDKSIALQQRRMEVDADSPQQSELYLCFNDLGVVELWAVNYPVKVLPSFDEYLEVKAKEGNRDHSDTDRHKTIFWCKYGINQNSRVKNLLSEGFLNLGRTDVATGNNNKKKRSRADQITEQFMDASRKLMLSEIPERLPCREKEHEEIYRFMKNAIQQGGVGSGLYLSGMPGTGKTATCRQIARELKQLTQQKKLAAFRFEEINAMKLPTPHHVYTVLYKMLTDKHCAPTTAVNRLETYFTKKDESRGVIVLLIDELDYLLTRKQNVIYNLFDWPTRANAQLVVIGIANTMDLPERLMPRVSSRLGLRRIIFKAYTKAQLQKIITARLETLDLFDKDAIAFCAGTVASVSGDCRSALQICRRAITIATKRILTSPLDDSKSRKKHRNNASAVSGNGNKYESSDKGTVVTMHDVKAAKNSFTQSNDIQLIQTLSTFEKLFLTAVVVYNGTNRVVAGELEQYKRRLNSYIQSELGENSVTLMEMEGLLGRLEDISLISVQLDRKEWKKYIRLNSTQVDVLDALNNDSTCSRLLSKISLAD